MKNDMIVAFFLTYRQNNHDDRILMRIDTYNCSVHPKVHKFLDWGKDIFDKYWKIDIDHRSNDPDSNTGM